MANRTLSKSTLQSFDMFLIAIKTAAPCAMPICFPSKSVGLTMPLASCTTTCCVPAISASGATNLVGNPFSCSTMHVIGVCVKAYGFFSALSTSPGMVVPDSKKRQDTSKSPTAPLNKSIVAASASWAEIFGSLTPQISIFSDILVFDP